jgi:hypothetical protein
MSYEKINISNSSNLQLAINEFKVTEEEYKLRPRLNSCNITSFEDLDILDFVPKLK